MPDGHGGPGAGLAEAQRVLTPGGFLQFSILHPCFVPPYRKVRRDPTGEARVVEVAGDFDRIDGRIDTWTFSALPPEARATVTPFRIPRFHRTLSEWVALIGAAGLVIERFVEPCADPRSLRGVLRWFPGRIPLTLHAPGKEAWLV